MRGTPDAPLIVAMSAVTTKVQSRPDLALEASHCVCRSLQLLWTFRTLRKFNVID